VRSKRIAENPFAHVKKGRTEVDRQHDRRELSSEELARLITITQTSDRGFRGLDGMSRAMLYMVATSTGFRASALASLTPESFVLDEEPPVVVLAARFNKNRKPRRQPIPEHLVGPLREFLSDKRIKQPIWNGTWASDHRGAEMIRKDLAHAAIPYAVEGPDGPLFADFHALRHTYVTQLGRNGVDLRTAQELTGHASPLHTARYSHRGLSDMAKAVQKLPAILMKGPKKEEVIPNASPVACPKLAQIGDILGRSGSAAVSQGEDAKKDHQTTQPPISQGFSHELSASDRVRHERGRRDSNPQPPDRQSGTLTN